MKKRMMHTGLLLVVILSLMLVACQTGPPPTPEETPTDGGTTDGTTTDGGEQGGEEPGPIPVPGEQDPISVDILLDPALATDADSARINTLVYDRLLHVNEEGTPVAGLAESWIVSEDGLEYTLKLRSGLTFHDGSPIDADALIVNFNRWFKTSDPLHGSGTYQAWADAFGGFEGEVTDDGTPVSSYDGIEKVDNLTVLLHFNRPDPNVLTHLASVAFSIVNPAALSAAGENYGRSGSDISGSGAYLVGEWTESELVLNPYTEYWGVVPEDDLIFPLQ